MTPKKTPNVRATSILTGSFQPNVRATSITTGSLQPNVRATSILTELANVKEVPPSVIQILSNMATDSVNLDTGSDATHVTSAQATTSLKPAPPMNLSDIKAGDIIFVVATPESVDDYRDIIMAQKFQLNKFCHHKKELPVLAENVVHCDVATADGELARILGPYNSNEWVALGSKSKSAIVSIQTLKNPKKDYVVLRPKNENIAKRMSETAERVISQPITYDVLGWFDNALLHNRGEEDSLTDDEAPPKPPVDIPNSMYCSEFTAKIVMDGERENRKNERAIRNNHRSALTEASIRRSKVLPAELIDKLAGSGNYEIFMIDKSEG